MRYVSVDIEADGPIPGPYSMISLGAVVVEPPFDDSFYCTIRPISEFYIESALAVSGFTREETMEFNTPEVEIARFNAWVKDVKLRKEGRPEFIADNNGFDWQFVNWYLHTYEQENPFGWSSHNLNDLFKGVKRNMRAKFKKYRITKHSHNALDDAKGNAEAAYTILTKYGLLK
ncbi:hypothetical protein LCGC14_1718100 [marine sediment metagenome]|uniref:Exonuclease domain-containing protein n=1 Tax=marine sediment metagenome TaxID=412755 RepID=A0A0F9JTN6_9ZZZZ